MLEHDKVCSHAVRVSWRISGAVIFFGQVATRCKLGSAYNETHWYNSTRQVNALLASMLSHNNRTLINYRRRLPSRTFRLHNLEEIVRP